MDRYTIRPTNPGYEVLYLFEITEFLRCIFIVENLITF